MLTAWCEALPVAMAESNYSAFLFTDGTEYLSVYFRHVQTTYNIGDAFYAEVYSYTESGEMIMPENYIINGFCSEKAGEAITATVNNSVDVTNCDLYFAGYSQNGELTFAEKSDTSSAFASIADGTATIKAMFWTKD